MLPVLVDKHSMLPPAVCFKCRGDQGSPRLYWMFMGATLDWEGAVYYCNECLYDIVKAMPDAFKMDHVEKLIAQYEEEAVEIRKMAEEALRVRARLRFLGFDIEKLLSEDDDGRNDGSSFSTKPLSDDSSDGEQPVFEGTEQETDGPAFSGNFRVGRISSEF